MRLIRILLVIIAVVCIGVAVSYPIRYRLAQNENNSNMDELAAMRASVQDTDAPNPDASGAPVEEEGGQAPDAGEGTDADMPRQPAASTEEEEEVTPDMPKRPAASAEEEEEVTPDMPRRPAASTEEEEEVVPDMPKRPTRPPEAGDDWPSDAWSAETGEGPASVSGGGGAGNAPGSEGGSASGNGSGPGFEPTPEPTPVAEPDLALLELDEVIRPGIRNVTRITYRTTPEPEPTPRPTREPYTGPMPYPLLEKVPFDEGAILPELREIYALNHDLVGWINIPGTVIDYPVVQSQDSDYYLEHDFYGKENINGQIILDSLCDPYTPSYNLIISGHHMKNGSMFGDLPEYRIQSYWEKHKLVEFDSLMFRKRYVVFAAFYSADYDEDEEGFRYNANIQYKMEARKWLEEIEENRLYDTGIDVQFGDEFITLTTCNRARHRNGRFVVVCRKIREGETIE